MINLIAAWRGGARHGVARSGLVRRGTAMGVVALAAATLTGCGDDDDFNEPDVGEQQRQACVDSGKVALIDDRMIIGCVTVEQYNEMRNYVEETSSP